MNCEQARELCQDRCDGDLSRGLNDELAAHVRSCAACREYERQMAALIGGLDTLRDESAALMFAEPAAAPRVVGGPKIRSWAVAARIAAAVVLMVGAGQLANRWLGASKHGAARAVKNEKVAPAGPIDPVGRRAPAVQLVNQSARDYLVLERPTSQANVRMFQLYAVVTPLTGEVP